MEEMISRKMAIDSICRTVCDNPEICESPCDEIKVLEIMPSAQPETHDKRTETHSCDCISRQAAMEEISKQQTYKMFEGEDTLYLDANDVGSVLASLPSAQPDMSEYSDKLWQKAYERGKAEAQAEIIRCKDCKYWREHKYAKETKRYIPFCGLNAIYTKSDDFCNRAERRTDG